jgi:hypothetical protein
LRTQETLTGKKSVTYVRKLLDICCESSLRRPWITQNLGVKNPKMPEKNGTRNLNLYILA